MLLIIFLSSCHKDPLVLYKQKHADDTGIYFNNRIEETDSFNILTSEYIFNGGGVAVGDFNNDGFDDILVGARDVCILRTTGRKCLYLLPAARECLYLLAIAQGSVSCANLGRSVCIFS